MNEMTQARMLLGRNVVERASAMALDYYSAARLAVEDKGPGDVVTEADFAIERAVREAVVTAFPEDRFVGEEFGGDATDEGYSWLIDPIDGTVNFARRIGYFCVSLALLQDGRPIAAWIYDPASKELFWAGPDGCALLGEEPLRCATEANFASTIIGLGFSTRHDKALHATVTANIIAAGADYRRLGAGALCLAHVAAGRLDAYVEPHMNPWDAVGGLYIAACAGAVTLDYLAAGGLRNGAPVFAASPSIATELLGLLPDVFRHPASSGK